MLITVVRKSSAARKNRKRVVTVATTRPVQAILGRCRHVRRYGFAPCPYHGRNTRLGEKNRRKGWRREGKHTTFINFQKVLNTKREVGEKILHLPPTSWHFNTSSRRGASDRRYLSKFEVELRHLICHLLQFCFCCLLYALFNLFRIVCNNTSL